MERGNEEREMGRGKGGLTGDEGEEGGVGAPFGREDSIFN